MQPLGQQPRFAEHPNADPAAAVGWGASVPTAPTPARRPGIPWIGILAAIVFVLAATGVLRPWVSGTTPEIDGTAGELIDMVGFEPGEEVTYKGLDIPGLGGGAAAVALVGAGLAIAGVVTRRPLPFLVGSGGAGAVALLAGIAIVLLAWLEIDNIPFNSWIPSDVKAQIPDPEVEAGLWIYFVGAAIGGVLCSIAAVTSYRSRHGVYVKDVW